MNYILFVIPLLYIVLSSLHKSIYTDTLSYTHKRIKIVNYFSNNKDQQFVLHKSDNHIYRNRTIQSKFDLSDFNQIILINLTDEYVHVEGLTRFDDLLDYTLAHGYMPQVVPELRSLTIGGVISGVGLESSSFKYGLFHDTAIEYEVITGNGDIVICNNTTNTDLYYGLPNSYGTLGYVLSAKIKIVKAKPYVKISNTHFTDPSVFIQAIEEYKHSPRAVDFVDGLILDKTNMYISEGVMVDNVNGNKISSYGIDIYYKSIPIKKQDYLTIKGYIWRYDSNYFYLGGDGNYLYENRILRTLAYPFLRSDIMRKLDANVVINLFLDYATANTHVESIVNDLSIDTKIFTSFLEWFDNSMNVYPVWICPYRTIRDTFFLQKDMYEIDFGVGFGVTKEVHENDEPHKHKKIIDQKMFEMKQKKGLYSTTYLSFENFQSLYDEKQTYNPLKSKYDTNKRFPTLYSKVCENV